MRKLGQHFLTAPGPLRRITAALDLRAGETIVEIGPGHGELTQKLLAAGFELSGKKGGGIKIIAIEKDTKLVEFLKNRFKDEPRLEVVEGDALRLLPDLVRTSNLEPRTWLIAGNIPYYITGHLFRIVENLPHKPRRAAFLIQKEVAERLAAQPPRMNRLAASMQFWAAVKIVERVPRIAFRPPPRVDSAVVCLDFEGSDRDLWENYETVLRAAFAQPRKTIRNNLRALFGEEMLLGILEARGISPGSRPQDLSIQNLRSISKEISPLPGREAARERY